MKKIAMLLAIGLFVGWGLIAAQDNSGKPSGPSPNGEGNRPAGRGNREMRPPMNPFEQIMNAENPKAQAEMKRHGEAMQKIMERVKALNPPMPPKDGGSQGRIEPGQEGNEQPDAPEHRSDRDSEAKGPPPEGANQEEITKKRPEAEKIADDMLAEMTLFYQNMAKIMVAENKGIKAKLIDAILHPPRMPMRGNRDGHNNPGRNSPPEGQDQPKHPDMPGHGNE